MSPNSPFHCALCGSLLAPAPVMPSATASATTHSPLCPRCEARVAQQLYAHAATRAASEPAAALARRPPRWTARPRLAAFGALAVTLATVAWLSLGVSLGFAAQRALGAHLFGLRTAAPVPAGIRVSPPARNPFLQGKRPLVAPTPQPASARMRPPCRHAYLEPPPPPAAFIQPPPPWRGSLLADTDTVGNPEALWQRASRVAALQRAQRYLTALPQAALLQREPGYAAYPREHYLPTSLTLLTAQLPAELAEQVARDPVILWQTARMIPARWEGATWGLRLSYLQNDSPLALLGLREGDVLTAVNGLAVGDDSSRAGHGSYQRLARAPFVVLEVWRDGRLVVIAMDAPRSVAPAPSPSATVGCTLPPAAQTRYYGAFR